MVEDVRRLIEEADQIARRVSRLTHRRALGLSYIYWSSITTAYGILFTAMYEFDIKALQGWLANVVAGLIFMTYYLVYRAVVLSRLPRPRLRRIYGIAMWAVVAAYYAAYALSGLGLGLYLALLYKKILEASGLQPRRYDYAAWAALATAMVVGPFYYVVWLVVQLIWVFAGVASLLEAEEGYGN